mmetsp:Transcript_23337/g.78447  ORF Transcript_23337/g.78447 Transcript_23337/m.78447 type:complete len:352 (-) Transcript_23337:82-1137(-)
MGGCPIAACGRASRARSDARARAREPCDGAGRPAQRRVVRRGRAGAREPLDLLVLLLGLARELGGRGSWGCVHGRHSMGGKVRLHGGHRGQGRRSVGGGDLGVGAAQRPGLAVLAAPVRLLAEAVHVADALLLEAPDGVLRVRVHLRRVGARGQGPEDALHVQVVGDPVHRPLGREVHALAVKLAARAAAAGVGRRAQEAPLGRGLVEAPRRVLGVDLVLEELHGDDLEGGKALGDAGGARGIRIQPPDGLPELPRRRLPQAQVAKAKHEEHALEEADLIPAPRLREPALARDERPLLGRLRHGLRHRNRHLCLQGGLGRLMVHVLLPVSVLLRLALVAGIHQVAERERRQ